VLYLYEQGAAKRIFFAVLSAIAWNFKVKFYGPIQTSYMRITVSSAYNYLKAFSSY